MPLTDREQEQLKSMIDPGQPLLPRYRSVLFADATAHDGPRSFHTLFVWQEEWEAHWPRDFEQLVEESG